MASPLAADTRLRTLLLDEYGFISNSSSIERRAQHYGDPIECLRYLRKATAGPGRPRLHRGWIFSVVVAMAMTCLRSDAIPATASILKAPGAAVTYRATNAPNVWPVEQNKDYDLYSNGLRIENSLSVANEPRSYYLISRESGELGPVRTQPAGIVFHTTESDQKAFEPEQKGALQRIGHDLLLFVRNMRAYHFVIDRFGQVHRIVVESDSANHAGASVWADSKWSYIDLNSSFLSVAFEARMHGDPSIVTEAQLRAAKALTEMLRAKYNILGENCVLHAQISVNPSNWLIGLHIDWGFGFPFQEMGLPDNYQIPNPAIYLYGFGYDSVYTGSTGPDLWNGLAAADERVREAAARRRMTLAEYRKVLQHKFQETQSAAHKNAGEEKQK